MTLLTTNTSASSALVIGASGGLGAALAAELLSNPIYQQQYFQVLEISRSASTAHSQTIDYENEESISESAAWTKTQCKTAPEQAPLRLIIVATGYLHSKNTDDAQPERSFQHIDVEYLHRVMLVNAIGPALIVKHFAPLLPKTGEVRMAFISAKVGSIGDNALGGWYGYRASKAALNQIVKTSAIELKRLNPQTICASLHPGTVATALSAPFSKTGLNVRSPQVAAKELLSVTHALTPLQTGDFFDYTGKTVPW